MKLFRAEAITETLLRMDSRGARLTMRLPVNVPFIIDNLWEHLRPDHMPCRRHAVFASPSPSQALNSASTSDKGLGVGVYELVFTGPVKLAQLQVKDARFHEDLKVIVSKLPAMINEKATGPAGRQEAAMLFLPGATKANWSELAASSPVAADLIAAMASLSTFWRQASAIVSPGEGEIFCELGAGASYTPRNLLRPAGVLQGA